MNELFAPAQFFDRTDAEKLAAPSFEPYDAGVRIADSEQLDSDHYAVRNVEFELNYIDSQRDSAPGAVRFRPDIVAFDALAVAGAVAQSPLSFAVNRTSALAPGAAVVGAEGYHVVSIDDLSPIGTLGAASSEREARRSPGRGRRRAARAARPAAGGPRARGGGVMPDRIASYTFLPWLRQGIASEIDEIDRLGAPGSSPTRADLDISVDLNGAPVTKTVSLVGPGDVDRPQPARRRAHRAAALDHQLRAQLSRLRRVLRRGLPVALHAGGGWRPGIGCGRGWCWSCWPRTSSVADPTPPGPLPAIRLDGPNVVPTDLFPPVDRGLGVGARARQPGHQPRPNADARADRRRPGRARPANPDQATSRVIAPRRLDPLTPYTAFLVPAFEVGRQAGLGVEPTGDGQAASWGAAQVEYPVYYEWSFGTSEQGDFEYLVGLLEARPVDDRVGIRDMDVQRPGSASAG